MFKIAMFAVVASLSVATVPAMASPVGAGAAAPDGARIEGGATPAAVATPAKEIRYCVISTVTGSRIPSKECHTRKDWISLTGVDPLEKN
jgi:hypothetical protein